MENSLQTKNDSAIIEQLVIYGDLSQMTPPLKVRYYHQFCESLGLNPLTQPFQIIKFQGKEKLYATKDCTEQLRKIHGVSITEITSQELRGIFVVTAKAQDKNGKTDAATGAVTIDNLKGDALANALMKAETKAKRRVTLSICGLGMLDESELETMPLHETRPIEQTYIPQMTEEEIQQFTSIVEGISDIERDELMGLLGTSSYEGTIKDKLFSKINSIVSREDYQKAKDNLLANQLGIESAVNPGQKEINRHVRKISKQPA